MQYSCRIRHDGKTFRVTNVKMLLLDSGALPLHYIKLKLNIFRTSKEEEKVVNKVKQCFWKMFANSYTYIRSWGKKLTDSITLNERARRNALNYIYNILKYI